MRSEGEPCYQCDEQNIFGIVTPNEYQYPVMTETTFIDDPTRLSPKPSIRTDLPSEFNWREYLGGDYTTPPRDQAWCGSCWLFGAISTLESIIEIREGCPELNPDLSEQYVLSCLPSSAAMFGRGCRGGTPYRAFQYIQDNGTKGNNINGIIPEWCFKYRGIDLYGLDFTHSGFDPVECEEKCQDWETYVIPISDYGYWHPHGTTEDILAIKSQVYESGPVTTCYFVNANFSRWIQTHHNATDYFHYEEVTGTNHCVEIVGWKDDATIPQGGYWIIKNSWGPYPGYDDGFFNIEYGSLNIDGDSIHWVEYDPALYNWPPQANAGGPYSGSIGEVISFDAGESFDPENEIISYHWDFGDGSNSNRNHQYTCLFRPVACILLP